MDKINGITETKYVRYDDFEKYEDQVHKLHVHMKYISAKKPSRLIGLAFLCY